MRISRITLSHHQLPLDPAFRAAWDDHPKARFDFSIVRVETDDGLVGFGSGDAMPGFGGHEELFIGQDPRALDRHFQIIDNLSFHYGRCWPLDIALWDLFGKIAGQPCWRLLGGASRRLRVYASSGAAHEPRELAKLAERYLREGFRAMKVRFTDPNWRVDLDKIEMIRRTVGDEIELMVDGNQSRRAIADVRPLWRLKDALELARELERLEVYWLEDALPRGDVDGVAQLRRSTRIRIAGGAMARELHELTRLVEDRCLDIVQPDATKIGGISGVAGIARMAVRRGLGFSPNTWGNGLGLMANAQLAGGIGGCPYIEFPYDPPDWNLERRDFFLRGPITLDDDGYLTLPEEPGLGIELDEDRLAATLPAAPVKVEVVESTLTRGIRRLVHWLRG